MADEVLDLRGVTCPLTWAKARIRLEAKQPGESLCVLLDDARSVRDVPRAAEASGYVVDEPRLVDGVWQLTISV
jgi:tRNA 2-thiouridine synthesizing protein A